MLCGQRWQRFAWPALSEAFCRREGRPLRPWPGRLEAAGTAGARQATGARDRGARRPRASQLGAGCWLRDGRWGQSASRRGGRGGGVGVGQGLPLSPFSAPGSSAQRRAPGLAVAGPQGPARP